MERLGVSYFPLYPLQMILHLYMSNLEFETSAPVLLYSSLPQFSA